jgi:5-(carboxyamino)imidazole ribonucleotide synthase
MTRVGIIGGGQLGRMLALAGYPLGIRCTTLDPGTDTPAAQVAPASVGGYDHRPALAELAERSDVVTYEFENVPVEAMRWVLERVPVHPSPEALEVAQDRLLENRLFGSLGLAVPPFVPVDSLPTLSEALAEIGTPAVLKTRRLGYDGKGQAVIRDPLLAEDAWRAVGEVPSILEAHVVFDRELSVVAARGHDGTIACYPVVENHHREGILRLTLAPAPRLDAKLQAEAETQARAVMVRLDYVGVIAIELFQVDEALLVNEMAPRVHNSGHWTIEGAETSQFEQHLRAVTGLPLGPAGAVGRSAMVNVIGAEPDLVAVAAIPGAHLHRYGKAPRPARKLGHITVRAPTEEALAPRLLQVRSLVDDAVPERSWPT